jgi:membrane-bound serine protease (ClpP class)
MSEETVKVLWGFGLFLAAVVLFFVEILIPSGGVIGFVAAAVGIAGIVAFWQADTVYGVISLLTFVVMLPLLFNFALKVFPHTPFGKHLILGDVEDEDRAAAETAAREREERERAEALVGLEGSAATDLRPVGSATFDGKAVEVVAEAGFVEQGQRVRITRVEGKTVKVRAI